MDSSTASDEGGGAVNSDLADVSSGQERCDEANSMSQPLADVHATSTKSHLEDDDVAKEDFFEASLFVDER